MPLREFLSSTWDHIQDNLFPWLREELGPLTDLHKRVIVTLGLARVETLVGVWRGLPGRPPSDRAALARAFVAKAVMGRARARPRQGLMPPDVRHPGADLRSTLAIDHLTAIRAPPNLTPTTPRTAELRPEIANASDLRHRDPMQACKRALSLTPLLNASNLD